MAHENFLRGHHNLAAFLFAAGRLEEARVQLLLVYHAQGRTLEPNAALAGLIASSATADPFRLAEVHAYRGDADKAFEWLELAASPTDPENGVLPGFRELWEMRASPILAPPHADPRWARRAALRRNGPRRHAGSR